MKRGHLLSTLLILITFIFATQIVYAQEAIDTGSIDVQEKSNAFLSKNITLSAGMQFLARVVFGIEKGKSINLQAFVVYSTLWLILFFIISAALTLTPFFGRGWKAMLAGIVITLLIAQGKAILAISNWLLSFAEVFGFLKEWSVFKMVFVVVLLLILAFGALFLVHVIKNQIRREEAQVTGFEAGLGPIKRLFRNF